MSWRKRKTNGRRRQSERSARVITKQPRLLVFLGNDKAFVIHEPNQPSQIRPWVLETIELFGPARCMFASHMRSWRPGRPVYKSHTTRSSSASPALCAMTEARTARVEDRHSSVEPSQLYAARKARLSTAFNAVPRVAVRAIGSAALANRRKSSVRRWSAVGSRCST